MLSASVGCHGFPVWSSMLSCEKLAVGGSGWDGGGGGGGAAGDGGAATAGLWTGLSAAASTLRLKGFVSEKPEAVLLPVALCRRMVGMAVGTGGCCCCGCCGL